MRFALSLGDRSRLKVGRPPRTRVDRRGFQQVVVMLARSTCRQTHDIPRSRPHPVGRRSSGGQPNVQDASSVRRSGSNRSSRTRPSSSPSSCLSRGACGCTGHAGRLAGKSERRSVAGHCRWSYRAHRSRVNARSVRRTHRRASCCCDRWATRRVCSEGPGATTRAASGCRTAAAPSSAPDPWLNRRRRTPSRSRTFPTSASCCSPARRARSISGFSATADT